LAKIQLTDLLNLSNPEKSVVSANRSRVSIRVTKNWPKQGSWSTT